MVLSPSLDDQRCYCTAAVKARREVYCPPPLNPAHPDLHAITDKWVAFRVQHQAEKMLSRALLEVGAPYVFPFIRLRRTWGGRRRESELPLFPRTIVTTVPFIDFLHHPLLSKFVFSRITIADNYQSRFVRELEQASIYSDRCPTATPFTPMQVKGTKVRVKDGPFMNFEGTVIGWKDSTAVFAIEVSMFGEATTLEIGGENLETL